MFKNRIFRIFLVIALAVLAMPIPSFAESAPAGNDATMVVKPAKYPGLPPGVRFDLKTEENGLAIFATIFCDNPTDSLLYIKTTGGVVSVGSSKVYSDASQDVVAEVKLPEGAYDVPPHSKVVMGHGSLSMKPSPDKRWALIPVNDWLVRAQFDVIPVFYSSIPPISPIHVDPPIQTDPPPHPTSPIHFEPLQPAVIDPVQTEMMVAKPAPLEDSGDVHCLAYPICYETPITIVLEDTIQMDYRWQRLDTMMDTLQKVNSNVVSTQSAVYNVGAEVKSQLKLQAMPVTALSAEKAKPVIARPTR